MVKNENKKFIIKLVILLAFVIAFSIFLNSKFKFYQEGETAFCTGKFPKKFCVDKMNKPISGVVYDSEGILLPYKDGVITFEED